MENSNKNIYKFKEPLIEATLIKRNSQFTATVNLDGEEIETPSLNEQISYCKELVKDLIEEKGEYVALRVARGIVTKFFDGFPKAKKLKMRLSTELNTYDDLENIINDYLEEISI